MAQVLSPLDYATEMVTPIIRKQFFYVTDVCVCVIGKLSPRQFMYVIGASTEKYLVHAPYYTKEFLPEGPV